MDWTLYWLGVLPCIREQGAGIDIFAQASSSRLGENSRSSPKFMLEHSLRRRAAFFSDEPSHSSEKAPPKRELAKSSKAYVRTLA